jgi:hypothetical protein
VRRCPARRHCPPCRSAAVPVALVVVALPVMVVAVAVVVVVVVVAVAVVAVEVMVVVVAGSWLQLVVVVVDQMWEWFGLVLGDVASAEPQQYLFSQCGHQTSTRGAVVKRDIIVTTGG